MKITKQSKVTLIFEIRENNQQGNILEKYGIDEPFEFIYGNDELFEAFENKLEGLSINEEFVFSINSDDAFGEYEEDSIIEIPFDSLVNIDGEDNSSLEVGLVLSLVDEDEVTNYGIITNIDHEEKIATVDFNHPYSGMDIFIKGKIMMVENA
jgi:FKBP-type peptidyl-prolyl cis-trans isomerase SlyD